MGELLLESQFINWYNEINQIRNKENITLGNISIPSLANVVSASDMNNLINTLKNLYNNEFLNYADQSVVLNSAEKGKAILQDTSSAIDSRLLFLSKICANYINCNTQSATALTSFATSTYKVTNPPSFSTESKSDTTNSTQTNVTYTTTACGTTTNQTKQNCTVCNTNSTTSCKTFGQNITDGTQTTSPNGKCVIFSTNTNSTQVNNFSTNSSPGNLTTTNSTSTDSTNKTKVNNFQTYINFVTQSSGYQVKGE